MTTLEQLREKSRQYDEEHKVDMTARFRALVAKHGTSAVAAAAGLSDSSVVVYTRGQTANVSEYAVVKAEKILNNLS